MRTSIGAGRPVRRDLRGVLRRNLARRIGAATHRARPPPRPPAAGASHRGRARPPTGTPCTASSSAVPVRADSIS